MEGRCSVSAYRYLMSDILPSQLESLIAARDQLLSLQSRFAVLNSSGEDASIRLVELELTTTAHGVGLLISKMQAVIDSGVESSDSIDLNSVLGDVERTLTNARQAAMEFGLQWPDP